ncbi:hypothetical protein SRHO_G00164660 [Serrasalmus rhombeus]
MRNTRENQTHRGGRAKRLTERLRRLEHAEALRLCSGTKKDQEHKSAFQRMAGQALDIPDRNMLLYPHDPNQTRSPNGL